jgi:hypothetical protein
MQQEEILNIEFHRKRLFLKALNCSDSFEEAAEKLGVNTRTIFRWKVSWNIFFDKKSNAWKEEEKSSSRRKVYPFYRKKQLCNSIINFKNHSNESIRN